MHPASESGFLPGIFWEESIVMQISFVMLIFLLFSNQFFRGVGQIPGANCLREKPAVSRTMYTYLQNKRMRRCGVAPPPIIFERLKLPQQIIYRRKENLSESPNHQKYWENILVSRFYEQFSRNRRNLGHFRKFKKISNS